MDKFLFSQDRLKPKQSKSFSFDYKFTSSKDNIKECWSLIKWCPSIYEASDQCTRWSRHQNPLQFFHSFYFYLFIYFRNKDQEQHYYKWSCKKCLPPHLQNYRLQQEEKLDPQDILLFKSITEKVQRIIDFCQLLSVIKKKIHPVIPSLPGNTFTYTVFLQRHNPFNYEKLKHVLAIDLSDKSFLALHTYQNLGPWSFHLVMVLYFVLCIFLAFLELVPSWTKIFYVWVHIKMFKIASSMDVKARIKRFDLHLHNLLIKISLSPPHHIHFEARTQEPPPVHSKAIPTLLHN